MTGTEGRPNPDGERLRSAIRTLVVDDERPARAGLRKMLSADAELDVIECGGGTEAVRLIETGAIDLVFLDIHMRDLDGFGVIERIGAERMPVVVFTTAHNEHAIRAFEVCALDYLLKPVSDERLVQTVTRAKGTVRHRRLGAMSAQLIALLEQHASMTRPREPVPGGYRFTIRAGANTLVVPASAVAWIESADNYARVWTRGRSYLVREPLQRLEDALRPEGFVRIHRTAIVSIAHIREYRRTGMGRRAVVLDDGTRLPVSRERQAAVHEALRGRAV